MLIQTLKFTLRGMLRDLIRGLPARTLLYPRLKKNEFSASAVVQYTRVAPVEHDCERLKLSIVNDPSSCISKDDVRKDSAKFIRPRTFTSLLRNTIKTSGTNGQPLTLHQDYLCVLREEAFVYRQLRWAGYSAGDRKVWLRGDIIRPSQNRGAVAACRDWWTNTLLLSSYHLSNETAKSYVDSIEKFDPVLIQAYPSSIYVLASWMLANNVAYEGRALRGIVTSSETLTEDMQSKIETAFGTRVFDWYGQAERVIAIGTCEHGSRHVLSDYGRTELLIKESNKYELVGSGYNNRAMQLTRYRTGDYVELDEHDCPCHRVFPTVKRVLGRLDAVVVLSDGTRIGRLDHVFKGMDNVLQGQIVYRNPDSFTLRVVPGPHWSEADEARLKSNFKERIDRADVAVELVSALPRGANGKVKFVLLENPR